VAWAAEAEELAGGAATVGQEPVAVEAVLAGLSLVARALASAALAPALAEDVARPVAALAPLASVAQRQARVPEAKAPGAKATRVPSARLAELARHSAKALVETAASAKKEAEDGFAVWPEPDPASIRYRAAICLPAPPACRA
jgi:hypothetical protein